VLKTFCKGVSEIACSKGV